MSLIKWLWNPVTAWNVSSVVTWAQAAVLTLAAPTWATKLWIWVQTFPKVAAGIVSELVLNSS